MGGMLVRGVAVIAAIVLLMSCRDSKRATPAPIASMSASASSTAPMKPSATTPSAAPSATIATIATIATSAAPPKPTLPGDAGASSCRILYGPALQAWRGPAAIHAGKDALDVVFNEDGKPHALSVPIAPLDAKFAASPPPSAPATIASASYPPCAFGASFVFCASKAGDVSRSPRAGGAAKIVGAARSGTRIDAATIGGDHALMAYLASRKTTEGWTSEAWAVVDESPPVRISEDGSGATALDLAPRGKTVVAMMLDARSALTPVHARVLTFADKLDIGKDAVVFVGGPPERHTASTIATPAGSGAGWVLLPIAKDIATFGMAAIHVDEPPKVDSPVVWSTYPNGIDPAPMAATQGRSPMYVARVRPVAPEPGAAKGLEIGRLGDDGAFTSYGFVSATGAVTDVAIDVDAAGGVWLAYGDAAGTWLERRACP